MELVLGLIFWGFIIYYFVSRSRRKKREKLMILQAIDLDQQNNSKADNINSLEQTNKQIIFEYKDLDGTLDTRKIIPFFKSEYFLEGFCLETQKNELFEINRIASFKDGDKEKFESLGKDPSILSYEEAESLPIRNRTPITKDKSHKNWDERNPIEIFIRYENASGERKDRVIRLINYESNNITAHCKTANSMRTFRIDRIRAFYKDSKERLENFKTNPHFNRELLTISFLGFTDNIFNQYKQQGEIYNFRALKSVSKNTSIIVPNRELTESQQKRADDNHCAFIAPENFLHFLETGEVQAEL